MVKNKIFAPYMIVILIIAVVFTGCMDNLVDKETDKDIVNETPDSEKAYDYKDEESSLNKENSIIEEFRIISKTSPDPDVLIKFIDKNIKEVSTKEADEMIDTLEALLERNEHAYEGMISELDKDNELLKINGDKREFQRENIEKIDNEKLKTQVNYLYSNVYKLVNVEGEFYRTIDYSKLKVYDEFLSENLKSYIDIRSLESDNRTMSDGELSISFDELAQRIFKTEDYLKIASKDKRKEDILKEYEYKISAYLKGLPNTPIMDYQTKMIKKEVLESYKETIGKKYKISNIVKEYLKTIENNDNIIDENILKQADEFIVKALYDISIE